MKRILFVFLLLCSICISGLALSREHYAPQDGVEILIIVGSSQGDIPRSFSQVPIYGYKIVFLPRILTIFGVVKRRG